jgi:hypothetical protein
LGGFESSGKKLLDNVHYVVDGGTDVGRLGMGKVGEFVELERFFDAAADEEGGHYIKGCD